MFKGKEKMGTWELIQEYNKEDNRENPNRPRREDYPSKKTYRKAANKYNLSKMLSDDGIISYLVKRAVTHPGYGVMIGKYVDLKVKLNETT